MNHFNYKINKDDTSISSELQEKYIENKKERDKKEKNKSWIAKGKVS